MSRGWAFFLFTAAIVVGIFLIAKSVQDHMDDRVAACEATGGVLVRGPGNRPDNSYVCVGQAR